MRRRAAPSDVAVPERLARLVSSEWPPAPLPDHASEWQREHWHRLGPVHAWINARRVWSADYGDALGNPLERLLLEFQTRRSVTRAVHASADR
jgi:hypothetical protein